MNATKRKFNALLQGLSNPPPGSQDSVSTSTMAEGQTAMGRTPEYDAILQKRRRLGFPESTAPRLDTSISLGLSNLAASFKRTGKSSEPAKLKKDPPAKYCPGDRDELLKRLATYQEITDWTPKPDKINELEWAKRGWVCQGKERVRCLLCHKELVVKLRKESEGKENDPILAAEIEIALVDKYAELIVTSHQSDCLWRRQGCDDTLLRISFTSTKAVIADLKKRYHELCTRQSFLPYEFNLRLPDDFKLDDVLSQLPTDFFMTDKSPNTTPNRPALALALLGWQGLTNSRIGQVPNSASCHTCKRRLGLWMFKSKEVDDQGQVIVPAPMDYLDPVREHRFFCPWKSATAQNRGVRKASDPETPAWSLLIQSVKNESSLRGVYEGRTKSVKTPSKSGQQAATAPSTPARSIMRPNGDGTVGSDFPATPETFNADEDDATRDAKDKERWARLRKVKSLFDTKKLRRSMSRPGTRPGTPRSAKSVNGD